MNISKCFEFKALAITVLCFITLVNELSSQCTPPPADTCIYAPVLCALDSVNGYTCKNTDKSNKAGCLPLCPSGGSVENISWWAFVTNGGLVTINIKVSNCSVTGNGIQLGIWGDCNCSESVSCSAICNTATDLSIMAMLEPCKKYYFFVDGCSQDVCDFTISTVGGGSPKVPEIRKIIGPDTLCPSTCFNDYYVDSDTSICKPTYTWTIDNVPVQKDTSRHFDTSFALAGSFVLCVEGRLDNSSSTATCASFGPVCKTIFVTPAPVLFGAPINLCSENVPFKWHTQVIETTGVYSQSFTVNCCSFDSTLTFVVKPPPAIPDIYYLGCKGDTYTDSLNKVNYTTCQNGKNIIFKNATIDKCDSAMRLFVTFLDLDATIKEYCEGGKIVIETTPNDKTCIVQNYTTLGIDYKWYTMSDPGTILNSTPKFVISNTDKYCVDITLRSQLNTLNHQCTFTFCELLNEDDLKPKMVCPKGDLDVCQDDIARYTSDTIFPNNVMHIWTITNGTILTPNPVNNATIDIKWDFNAGMVPYLGKICYHYESDCPPSPECCITINVQPYPRPSAGPDKTVCGLFATLDGIFDAGGTWTQYLGVPGTISPNNVANPNISSSNFYGTCGYILTESRFGCATRDTVLVTFNEFPTNSQLTYVCESAQTSYTMKTDILKGKAPFMIVKGNGMIVNGNTYMSGIINNNVPDTIILKDANDCDLTIIHSHECNCDNEIGKISPTLQKVCEDQLVNLIYDKTSEKLDPAPNKDTVIFFIYTDQMNPLTSIIATLSSNTISYNAGLFVFGQTYYIGARLGRANGTGDIDQNKGCFKTSFGTPFVFVQNPKPIAGRDTSVCGNMFLLEGFQSIAGSFINWREVNGKSVKFQNFNQSSTTVEALGGFGTYEFELKETNDNLCTRTSNVKITFNENPDLSLFNRICTELGSSTTGPGKYKATIELKGGNPPYTLITPPSTGNGTINGNIWMSNDIISNDSFIVQVKDLNGCVSTIIRNTFNCNCGPIDVGLLDSNMVRACQDRCVAVISLIPESIDPAIEATMYVLHKGRNLNAILDTFYNLTDSICFNPKTMQLGINNPIFVTRIVGDDKDKDGNPDLDDDCKRVSNEFKIVFDEYPSPNAGLDDTICGLTADLMGILSFGNPTWTVVSGGTANFGNANLINTNVTVNQKGTYIFNLLGDNFNCQRNDQVRILFVDKPIFDTTSIVYECDNKAENYRIRIKGLFGDRASWNITGTDCNGNPLNGQFVGVTDVWESNFIPSGCTFTLRLKDRFDCATDIFNGSHICKCITKIDDIDLTPVHLCEDQSIKITYPQAPDTSSLDANDVVRYVLYDGLQNDPKNGTFISVNATGNFSFLNPPMITGKTYYISVFIGNLNTTTGNVDINDRCFAFTPGKPVTWYKYPVAKITGDTLLTCSIVNITLDAGSSTSGSTDPLKYKWSTNDTTQTINVTINGVYQVTVTDPRAGCTNALSFNVNRKVDLPKIAIDTPLKFTCDRTLVNIDGNRSDKGSDFKVTWSGPGVVSGANNYLSSVNQTGNYKFLLENIRTGCRDSVVIPVGEDKRSPNAKITQVGRLGCVIKEIKLDGSLSTGSAGNISTYTWIGNVVSGQNTSLITISSPGGRFILEVKDSNNGCIDRDTIDVIEEDNPLALIVLDTLNPKCFGERNGSISIIDILDKNGLPLTDIDISINGGPFTKNRNYNNLAKGVYNITVRDSKGCLLATSRVLIEPGPLNLIVTDTTVDQNSPVLLDSLIRSIFGGTVDQNGFYKDIYWKKVGDSIILTNKLIISDTTVEFTVTVVDQVGCLITKLVRINVKIIKDVWWPTVINPYSGIGENNRFNLYGKRVKNIKVIKIFSRWGELVYSAENIQDANKQKGLGWNGMYNGDYALPGVYVFYAEVIFDGATDKEIVKGDFTLLR